MSTVHYATHEKISAFNRSIFIILSPDEEKGDSFFYFFLGGFLYAPPHRKICLNLMNLIFFLSDDDTIQLCIAM